MDDIHENDVVALLSINQRKGFGAATSGLSYMSLRLRTTIRMVS